MNPPGSAAHLDDWLAWLEASSAARIELGLERVTEVLARLALPRPRHVLTVGGTNGKGSSVAMLEALLGTTGQRVGSYTSPHVLDYCERIRVDREPVDPPAVVAAFEQVEAVRGDIPLTYFEFGTLAALGALAAAGIDVAVLEVGLGGRLDAVNAVDPDASLITNVALDHCDWLGNDIESIAAEKAGIMRPGRPTVFGSVEVPRAIESAAARLDVPLEVAGRDFSRGELEPDGWDWQGRRLALESLPPPSLPGDHQLDNAAAVLALLEAAGWTEVLEKGAVARALTGVALPGRLQRIDALGRRWLLDGAHNPAGAKALRKTLPDLAGTGEVTAVLGVLDDKDADGMIRALAPAVDRWIACTADSPRAVPATRLAALVAAATARPCRIAGSSTEAMTIAHRASAPGDLILVAGSFYTIGSALRWLGTFDDGGDD